MGDSDKTDAVMKWSGFPRPWEKPTEVQVKADDGRVSIVEGISGLKKLLTEGTKTEIKALERTCDWKTDWSLVSNVYRIVCQDLSGQNRSLDLRDTKSLPKGFSYESVAQYYRSSKPPV